MNKCCNALLFFSKRIKKFTIIPFEKYSIINKLFTVFFSYAQTRGEEKALPIEKLPLRRGAFTLCNIRKVICRV